MKFNKQPIKNRHGLTMLVHFERAEDNQTNKLAIIQHGYSGSMEEVHIREFGETFLKNGFNVLMLDCTYSFNDADGNVEDNTAQSHYEDLEDAVEWASHQEWYQQPFALAGHSLGGLSIALYAENNPEKVSMLFPAALVVSGHLLEDAYKKNQPALYADFLKTKKMRIESGFKEGAVAYRPYSWLTTMYDWDALKNAEKLKIPSLFIVGSEDDGTPPEHQKLMFDKVSGEKEMHVIEGVDHCYLTEGGNKIDEVCDLLDNWIKRQA